jgi:Sec-independent protein translocase protein TatA
MGEITVILLLALIVLGPSKLPDLAAGLGKLIREIRKATSDVKNEIVLDDSFRKPFEELRDAVTLPPEELKRRDQIRRNMEEARKRADEEEAARAAAAAAAVVTPAGSQGALSLPAETPADAAPQEPVVASSPEASPVVAPVAPPAGTVARNRPTAPAPAEAGPIEQAAAHAVPAPPVTNGPRVVPPTSSLDGDRANVTQTLSEADLLASAPQQTRRRPTPPPLPGLSRPPSGRIAAARPTPAAPTPAAGPNATQVLSENDLLPSGAKPPPPAPDPKKT